MVAAKASTFNLMKNFFDLLGIEPQFELDEAALQQAYITIQQRCHPDRLIGKNDSERHAAIMQSMDANEVYEALKSPLHRAEHLLLLKGIKVNGEGADQAKPDQDLLMEMMELREGLAQAKDELSIAKARADIQMSMKNCSTNLAEAFAVGDDVRATQLTMRLRYLGKSLEEAVARHYQIKAAS